MFKWETKNTIFPRLQRHYWFHNPQTFKAIFKKKRKKENFKGNSQAVKKEKKLAVVLLRCGASTFPSINFFSSIELCYFCQPPICAEVQSPGTLKICSSYLPYVSSIIAPNEKC